MSPAAAGAKSGVPQQAVLEFMDFCVKGPIPGGYASRMAAGDYDPTVGVGCGWPRGGWVGGWGRIQHWWCLSIGGGAHVDLFGARGGGVPNNSWPMRIAGSRLPPR